MLEKLKFNSWSTPASGKLQKFWWQGILARSSDVFHEMTCGCLYSSFVFSKFLSLVRFYLMFGMGPRTL